MKRLVAAWGGLFTAWAAMALVILGGTSPAQAHWADLAVADVQLQPTRADVVLTIPTGLVERADDNRDGRLSAGEVATHRVWLAERLGAGIALRAAGEPIRPTIAHGPQVALPSGMPGETDRHSTLQLGYAWSMPTEDVRVTYDLFVPGVPTASCVATIAHGQTVTNVVFTPERRTFALTEPAWWQQVSSFVVLGVEHIVIGYDHVLFLIALLMLGGGLGYLLKMVTAFTVAHSITLALATFNLVALPGRLVESAIALSIVYVAAETFWRKDLSGRWVVTLLFGLIHGLGFASVLKELDLAGGNLALSLVGFNMGVELGQLAIVTAAFLALQAIRRQSWDWTFRRAVSLGVAAMGVFWFVERALMA